jgi:hypothetical protein
MLHSVAAAFNWHTPPDEWDEPRLFHSSTAAVDIEDRIVLAEVPQVETGPEAFAELDTLFSPNGAYWAAVVASDITDDSYMSNQLCFYAEDPDVSVYIYNERDYLIGLSLLDHYTNYTVTIEWINEKLLFLRVWWGRIAGSDLIVDVESESIIWHEMIWWGDQAFRQFQQAANDAEKASYH